MGWVNLDTDNVEVVRELALPRNRRGSYFSDHAPLIMDYDY